MRLTAALAGLATIVGIGAVAAQGPAVATVTNAVARIPAVAAAATVPTGAPGPPTSVPGARSTTAAAAAVTTLTSAATGQSSAATPGLITAAPPSTTVTPAPPGCDDGRWVGPDGINVEGPPDGFDAGDRGAVYLWHSSDGWHIRTTDVSDTAHHYTGTIALSAGARFTSFSTVQLERTDRVWVDGDNVLHYDFTTFDRIDGVNFTVSACDGARDHEAIHFDMEYDGHEDDPARIALGDSRQHPGSANFVVTRSS